MTSRQLLRAVVLLAVVLTIFPLAAQAADVPNADFTAGDDKPDGWTLTGGQGRWVDRQVLEVTGTGDDSNAWHSAPCEFTPGDLYHFRVRTRRLGGSGCVITGPSFANRDQHGVSSDWKWFGHVFRVPDNARDAVLRLGQWEATGSVQFDRVQLTRVLPVHRAAENLVLGQDESIRDGQYAFVGTFGHQGSNFHRTLQSTTTSFNSDRWCFGGSSQVTYRFAVPGHRLQAGRIALAVNYHTRGGCTAEISRDGKQWHALLTQSEMGDAAAELPDALLPAESLLLRLRGVTADSSFQVNRVEFHADLDGSPPELTGDTAYAEVRRTEPGLVVRQMTLTDHGSTGRSALLMQLTNRGSKPLATELAATIDPTGGNSQALRRQEVNLQPGSSTVVPVDLPAQAPGDHEVLLDVGGTQLVLAFSVPEFYRADYGQRIESIAGETAVWWCEATRKIPRRRAVPDDTSPAAQLSAARGDFEAVQVVVRPSKPLVGFTAKVSPLVGPNGATIAAENVDVLRVYYHFVHHPTDATGVRDWWPDALPPLDEPLDVPAGQNQPLWVLVHVPRDAAPGDYTATVQLAAEGWAAAVPVRLHVWNFALPVTNHLETAFGLSAGNVFRYHGLKTEADKRRVFDMYLKCFAEHRISPYDPVPLDPIGVKFVPEADPPRADVDFSAFDREMARVVDKHHFTGYRLPIQGMGGGTFHARSDPRIGDFTEETPEYQAMFSSYVKQLEEHLRGKGWLEMAYIYWFDEPAPRDYDFVTGGMERLKKYAPGLQRMLTEEPSDDFQCPVDIWCPVSFNYDHEAAERRRADGSRFWWYVCCGPKAPYCTLFIDHPATELRVWHWQTWQRKVAGTLVWQSNYWTSSAAYPDEAQNPYEDPMGYVSGYSTPRGTKRYWGNGDGRFIYPPLAAATPGASGSGPVIEPPVSSIRWEMLREGVEDYEYLYLLRELLDRRRGDLSAERIRHYESLLEVPTAITQDMTTFTTDPEPIYTRRTAIAEAIEALQ